MLNFPKLEEDILRYWQENEIFKKTLAKDSPKGSFTFYEGPPTANGKPGLHHVLARAFKDLIPRFKTMQGFLVERKAGWDTHGLPVEIQVEKELKISGKPEIEKYGIKEFNQKCKQSVWQYQEEWEKLTQRIGFWLDLEHPYVTYHKDYIESLWYIFKKIYERDLLYQGHKVVPHCPRCGTALSSHEVAQGYKEVTEPSVYVKFKVRQGNEFVKAGDYILSWTTTPWTLPGNVALAVGPKIDYVVIRKATKSGLARVNPKEKIDPTHYNIKIGIENFILAKQIFEQWPDRGDCEVLKEFKGEDLVGLEYEPLFAGAIPKDAENYSNAFKVYPADFVTTEDGTGIVHTAVMYGEDDYNLGTAVGLPKYHTVDEAGKFIIDFPGLTGKFVKNKEAEEAVINHLKQSGLFFASVDYTHDYPFCWRCSTPLLYYAKNSWFIKMSALSQDLIKENQTINWIPEYIKNGRFGEWLTGVKDWAISRERYWGTPLPIWVCQQCGQIDVIGSYDELGDKVEDDFDKLELLRYEFDPHRPYIDEYQWPCKCGGIIKRVPEVADCWFDSGSMPFAQHHYPFENKEKVDSFAYYPADFICEAIDQTRGWFYTLLAVGILLDKGAPYKNVICLGHINDASGQKMSKSKGNIVDPWEVINKWGADALRFHLYTVNQPGESKNFDLKNVAEVVKKNFLILFNVLTFYKIYAVAGKLPETLPESKNILDQWIAAKLNQLVVGVTGNLEQYNIFSAGRSISEFINELSTWYLRRSRDRFKSDDERDKQLAIDTLGFVLLTVAKVMAPFTPFVAEQLYKEVGGTKESVHLESWPDAKGEKAKSKILEQMDVVRKIVELALAKRDEAAIKVRQVLSRLTVTGAELLAEFSELIKDEVNIKAVVYQKGQSLSVELDTSLTQDLKEEGLYRELVRTVNQMRKEAGLTINDKVEIYYHSDSAMVNKVINQFKEELIRNTLSKGIIEGRQDGGLISKETEVNGEKIIIALK